MFEHVFVTNTGRTVRPYTVMISFAGQMALIGLGVLIPLLYTDTIPQGWWAQRVFLPPPPAGKAKADPPAAVVQETAQSVRRVRTANRFYAPDRVPVKVAIIVDPVVSEALELTEGFVGVTGGTGENRNGLPPSLAAAIKAPAAIAPPANSMPVHTTIETIDRVRVGGNVKPPVPIDTPQPAYPELARRARIQGTVRLDTVVATNGTVQNIRLVQGHPLLVPAAIAAVRTWRYRPPTLNGDPVEMEMQVDVIFTLGS